MPVVVTTRPSEYRNLHSLFADRGEHLRLGLGIHPEAAGSVYAEHELRILRQLFDTTQWIAEVGLDGAIAEAVGSFFGSQPGLAEQERMLAEVLALGVRRKVLSVHSRGAEGRLLDMLREAGAPAVALHWYRGNREDAGRAIELGYLFSVNVDMLETAHGRELIRWLPAEHLLFETDGPFTTVDGRPSEPRDVVPLARRVASLRDVPSDEFLAQTLDNFRRLESLAGSHRYPQRER